MNTTQAHKERRSAARGGARGGVREVDGEHHVQGRRPCRARLSISQLLLGAVRHAWLLCSICSRTKANEHYTGTQTGEARCAVARAEQAKIGLLTFPKYDTVESAI